MSIYVDFDHQTYMALVTVYQTEDRDEACEIRFLDDDLGAVVSDHMLRVNLSEGVKEADTGTPCSAGRLLTNTIKALRERLQPEIAR